MSDRHSQDYTNSPAPQQDNLGISVNSSLNALTFSIDCPWPVVAFVTDNFPCLFNHFKNAIAGHRAAQLSSRTAKADHKIEAEKRMREFRSIGRLASRLVRVAKVDGLTKAEAMEFAAQHFNFAPSTIDLMVSKHNQRRDRRYRQMRDYTLVRWASLGLSNKEIASRLKVTPGYAGRLVKQAIVNRSEAANDK